MPAPAVTITALVCTRARPALLRRCVTSILDCSSVPDEILVIVQTSEASDLDDFPPGDVRVMTHQGRGLAVAQNAGFANAIGDVVLVTDDDCVVSKDWVVEVRRAFSEDPRLDLLGGRVLPLGDDAPDRLAVSTRTSTRPLLLDDATLPWDAGSGNNFAVRRLAVMQIGGNDERLGPGAPLKGAADMDLFRRLLRSGRRGRYEPRVLVMHERVTAGARLERRGPYGYGMGAGLVLWRRQGDPRSTRLAVAWLRLRLARLRDGVLTGNALRIREELLVLSETVKGMICGARGPAGPVTSLNAPGPASTPGP